MAPHQEPRPNGAELDGLVAVGADAAAADGPAGAAGSAARTGASRYAAAGHRGGSAPGGSAADGSAPGGPRWGQPPGGTAPLPSSLEQATAGQVLGGYLRTQAAGFLRSLQLHGDSVGSAETAEQAAEAVRQLRRTARRMNGTLHTYRPLLDPSWADRLRGELSWLSGTLAREYLCAARLERLLAALHGLTADDGREPAGHTPRTEGARSARSGASIRRGSDDGGALPAGAARAGALLERQLTLARNRAHSAALHALGSARFHAVADQVAVLASEAPLTGQAAERSAAPALAPLAGQAQQRLTEAVRALPLSRSITPYNAAGLAGSLAAQSQQDAPWSQVRLLLRLHRYAAEVLLTGVPEDEAAHCAADPRLAAAGAALDRHREAAEAAEAATAAARTPRIAATTAYALGVLHAGQRHEVEAARCDFGRQWVGE